MFFCFQENQLRGLPATTVLNLKFFAVQARTRQVSSWRDRTKPIRLIWNTPQMVANICGKSATMVSVGTVIFHRGMRLFAHLNSRDLMPAFIGHNGRCCHVLTSTVSWSQFQGKNTYSAEILDLPRAARISGWYMFFFFFLMKGTGKDWRYIGWICRESSSEVLPKSTGATIWEGFFENVLGPRVTTRHYLWCYYLLVFPDC